MLSTRITLLALLLSATAVQAQRPARVGAPDPSEAVSVSPAPTLSGYDFFIVAGQSNAKGNGNAATSIEPNQGEGYAISRAGEISHLADPFGNAATGSAWPAFARAYTARTGRGVIMIPFARSGTIQFRNEIVLDGKHWDIQYPDNLYDHSADLAADAYIVAEASLPDVQFGGWLWIQGGADAVAIHEGYETPEEYEGAYHRMARAVYADWGKPLMHIVTGGWTLGDPPAAQAIRQIQNDGDELEEILVIYRDAYTFAQLGWHVDEVHWDQRGLNEAGTQGGDFVGRWYNDQTEPAPPPEPTPIPIPSPAPSGGISIAPNPSSGGMTPTITASCRVRFTIFDSLGRRLMKGRSDASGNIDLPSHAPSGQYSIRVKPLEDVPGCIDETETFTIL